MLFRPGETENKIINLYPEVTYLTFEGFGGAITEAAGTTYNSVSNNSYALRLLLSFSLPCFLLSFQMLFCHKSGAIPNFSSLP